MYVRFEAEEGAERAKNGILSKRFNDRLIESKFYSEDKFVNNIFD